MVRNTVSQQNVARASLNMAESDREANDRGGHDYDKQGFRVVQRRIPLRPATVQEYEGYIPLPGDKVARESIDDLDAESLWQGYVSTRRPVLIDGLVTDGNFEGAKWRDLNYLRSVAGSTNVKIEPIHPTNDRFGTNVTRSQVPLSRFLEMLKVKELAGRWYMTTQYQSDEEDEQAAEEAQDSDKIHSNASSSLSPQAEASSKSSLHTSSVEPPESPEGKPSQSRSEGTDVDDDHLFSVDLDLELPPPTDALAHLFPLPAPALMGGLVLQQCNLWMGNGTSGKSSGLHHDFHDNLYMLLSGRKRFLIWPPVAHRWLEPVGEVFRIHRNGLMEYHISDQPELRADGLTELEAASWRVRARQRAVLEADESAAQRSGEARKRKRQRKGKARQTIEQEIALLRLRQAEARRIVLEREERRLYGGGKDDEENDEFVEDDTASIDSLSNVFNVEENDIADPSSDEDDEEEESEGGAFPRFIGAGANRLTSISGDDDDDESDQMHQQRRPNKRQRHSSNDDVLSIPFGGLPGGLRGSVNDLDGQYGSASSDEFDERVETALFEHHRNGMDDLAQRVLLGDLMEAAGGEGQLEVEVGRSLHGGSEEEVGSVESGESSYGESEDGDSELDSDEADADLLDLLRRRIRRKAGDKGFADEEGIEEDDSSSLDEHEDDLEDNDDDDDDDMDWANAEDGEALLAQLARLDGQVQNSAGVDSDAESEDVEDSDEHIESKTGKSDPPSFSRISPQALHWYFDLPSDPGSPEVQISLSSSRKNRLLPAVGCPAPIEVHLKPGQMLYLPASWYHEVTSYCEPEEQEDDGANIHMALNYWFHPPSAVKRREQLRDVALHDRLGTKTSQERDKKITSNGDAAAAAAAAGSAANADHEFTPTGHTRPYVDEEVWNEIRLEVEKRCKAIRARAAARSEGTA